MNGPMSKDEIRTTVKSVLRRFAPEADLEQLPNDVPIREYLDIDSLDAYNILVQLHQKFGVEIPESDYGKLATMSAVIEYLSGKVSEGKPEDGR